MVCQSKVPYITIVTGRMFGVAGQCHHRPTGMFRRYCWPSGRWGSMPISGGTRAAYRREIEDGLYALASPFKTAEATGQDIIDPRETRELICEFVEEAQEVLNSMLGQEAQNV